MSNDALPRLPILVTGGSGQLGIELMRARWPAYYQPVAPNRSELDLCDPIAIRDYVERGYQERPFAAVINGGAYTAVDRAENDVVNAWNVNALAPAAFAEICEARDIPLVHLSTDYVFSGKRDSGDTPADNGWAVTDVTMPLSVYGASKLGGELAIQTSKARHAIVRTAWVVSAHGTNFVKTMLRLGTTGEPLRVVKDQFGSPTGASDLAGALVSIVIRLVEDRAAPTGLFHFSNLGKTSWAEFADEIFRQSALRGGPVAKVVPIPTSDYPTAAKRPAYSVLSNAALTDAYSIAPRYWVAALGDILDELIGPPLMDHTA